MNPALKATYKAHMGDDLMVVNAARVSFAKEGVWDDAGPEPLMLMERDAKLVRYLAKHGHWTPFAHPQITLHMRAPVFVRTQCFKHKAGFVENEVSRRYVDDEPEFFLPDRWRARPTDGAKQGSGPTMTANAGTASHYAERAMRLAFLTHRELLDLGVAPEQARMVLPQSMVTEWYWTGSLAAYARFVKQRTDPHAQSETRDLARQVSDIIAPLFPVSWAALEAAGG